MQLKQTQAPARGGADFQPLIHRVRGRRKAGTAAGTSSNVSESSVETWNPNRAIRKPRSASSVTFQASQPLTRRKSSVRQWLDVPPAGMGKVNPASPRIMTSNDVA
jgi:hypothetical protein